MPKWKLVSVRVENVLILTQDRCAVCAERTIGSEIILVASTIGSEIILVAPDGTPR